MANAILKVEFAIGWKLRFATTKKPLKRQKRAYFIALDPYSAEPVWTNIIQNTNFYPVKVLHIIVRGMSIQKMHFRCTPRGTT